MAPQLARTPRQWGRGAHHWTGGRLDLEIWLAGVHQSPNRCRRHHWRWDREVFYQLQQPLRRTGVISLPGEQMEARAEYILERAGKEKLLSVCRAMDRQIKLASHASVPLV